MMWFSIKDFTVSSILCLYLLSPAIALAQQSTDPHGTAQPDVRVVINEVPPYSYISDDGTPAGLSIERITKILRSAGLNPDFDILAWSRAYREATTHSNVLIAHLDRTADREDDFHWLQKLSSRPYHLFTLKDSPYAAMTLQEAVNSDGRVVCVHDSSQCNILREMGFPEERIWMVSDFIGEPLTSMVLNGRAQFWIESYELFTLEFNRRNADPDKFTSLGVIGNVSTYLAAHKGFDPALRARIEAGIAQISPRQTDDEDPSTIFVATTEVRPFFYNIQNGLVGGKWVSPVVNFLAAAGLEAKFHITPWARAMHNAMENQNVLIANIDRTPDREDKFEWLLPLSKKENFLFALKGGPFDGMTKLEVLESDGIAICPIASADCQALKDLGFPDHRILQVRHFLTEPVSKMLFTGRVAFAIGDVELSSEELQTYGMSPEKLSPLFKVNEVSTYLAAPKHLNPQLMERLIHATRR